MTEEEKIKYARPTYKINMHWYRGLLDIPVSRTIGCEGVGYN